MRNDPLLDQIYEKIAKANSHAEIDAIFTAAETLLVQRDMAARRHFWRDLRDRLSAAIKVHHSSQQDRWNKLLREPGNEVVLKAQGGDALGDLYNYANGQAAANARRS